MIALRLCAQLRFLGGAPRAARLSQAMVHATTFTPSFDRSVSARSPLRGTLYRCHAGGPRPTPGNDPRMSTMNKESSTTEQTQEDDVQVMIYIISLTALSSHGQSAANTAHCAGSHSPGRRCTHAESCIPPSNLLLRLSRW